MTTLSLEVSLFFSALKGQVNALNLVLLTGIMSFVFHRLKRRRTATILGLLCISLFLLFSTRYLPGYLVKNLEETYSAFQADQHKIKSGRVYIHVLGGGYTVDKRLPPLEQISQVGVDRLAEAVRIYHIYDSSVLVVSGNITNGNESVASVMRKSAISLGVDAGRIRMLEGPRNTLEEAKAFAQLFGRSVPVVLVTDAVHMPRAVAFFKASGVDPIPAPANYLVKERSDAFTFDWVPSAENFLLMDRVLREYLGLLKGRVFG